MKLSDAPVSSTPLVQKLKVSLRVIGAKVGPSKSSGSNQVELQLEIFNPDTVNIGGQTYSIAGQKTKMYLPLEKNPGEVLKFHTIMDLPVDIDTDDITGDFYAVDHHLAFEALLSSEESKKQAYDENEGKVTALRDENGNEVKGSPQWQLVGVRDIIRAVDAGV